MASEQTSSEYISHHLTNWTYGYLPGEGWKVAYTAEEAGQWALMLSILTLCYGQSVWAFILCHLLDGCQKGHLRSA